MALEIFKLVGSVFVDTKAADASLQKTDSKAAGVAKTLLAGAGKAAKFGGAVVAGAAAAVSGLTAVATKTSEACDHIDKQSQKLSMSAKTYQELDYICQLYGTDVDSMGTAMKTLTTAISGNSDAFEQLGLSTTDANGKMKSSEDMFFESIDALKKCQNETERNALANKLFGKSYQELLPLINDSGTSVEDLRKKAEDLGIVMSDDMVKSGASLQDSLTTLKTQFQAVLLQLGSALMPVVQKVCDYISSLMPTIIGFAKSLEPVITSFFSELMPPLMDLANQLIPIIINLIQILIPPITQIVKSLIPPLVQIIQILIPPLVQIINQLLPIILELLEPILGLLDPLVSLLQPIMDLIVAIIQPLLQLLEQVIQPIIQVLTNYLKPIIEAITKVLQPLVNLIGQMMEPVSALIGAIMPVANQILEPLLGALSPFFDMISPILELVIKLFQPIMDLAELALKPLIDLFNNALKPALDGIRKIAQPIIDVFEGLWKAVSNAFNNIRKAIKLPHFGIKPSGWKIGDLLKGSIPKLSIDWYAKGGVLNKPTAFGMNGDHVMAGGEAGPEAVAPISTLQKYIADAVGERDALLMATLKDLMNLLQSTLPQMTDQQLVLDTGELVGATIRQYDEALGQLSIKRKRGV